MLQGDFLRNGAATAGALALAATVGSLAQAQLPDAASAETVVWAAGPAARADAHGRALLAVQAAIRPGWHVYALKQADTGPVPLKAWVEPKGAVTAAGKPRSDKPIAAFDAAFGLVTPYHADRLALWLPVTLKPGTGAGRHQIPVNVRFQSCDGRICLPPRTVQIQAVVETHAG